MHAVYVSLGEYFTLLCRLEIGILMLTSRRSILSPFCARQDVSSTTVFWVSSMLNIYRIPPQECSQAAFWWDAPTVYTEPYKCGEAALQQALSQSVWGPHPAFNRTFWCILTLAGQSLPPHSDHYFLLSCPQLHCLLGLFCHLPASQHSSFLLFYVLVYVPACPASFSAIQSQDRKWCVLTVETQ